MKRKRKKRVKQRDIYRPPSTKLTINQVSLIKSIIKIDREERKEAGHKRGTNGLVARMAQQFGVSWHTIRKIRQGRSWKRIGPRKLAYSTPASRQS
jgi:hypothetical protein